MKHYFKEVIDPWLDTLLASMPEAERKEAKRQIKLKLLESYRNGFDKLMDKFDGLTNRFEAINSSTGEPEKPAVLRSASNRNKWINVRGL